MQKEWREIVRSLAKELEEMEALGREEETKNIQEQEQQVKYHNS